MSNRYSQIGIKQVLRYEWLQKAAELYLSDLESNQCRRELHDYLQARRRIDVNEGSSQTRTFVVNNLMSIWVDPPPELITFRNHAGRIIRNSRAEDVAVHWAMVSATYPFWMNVAKRVGRLLNIQDQVSQAQVVKRLKEQYGDRQTISRYSRYVIRSMVDWNVLQDCEKNGWYRRSPAVGVDNSNLVALLIQSLLYSIPEGRLSARTFQAHPALFPFVLNASPGVGLMDSELVEVLRHSTDEIYALKS